jgi:hypothetical protein
MPAAVALELAGARVSVACAEKWNRTRKKKN